MSSDCGGCGGCGLWIVVLYDVVSCFSETQAAVLQLFSLSNNQRALLTVLWNLSSPKQFYTPQEN